MNNAFINLPKIENLEDHYVKIKEVLRLSKCAIDEFDKKRKLKRGKEVTEQFLDIMDNKLHRCLHKVADLSTTRSDVKNELKEYYTRTYLDSPKVGKKLFIDHNFELHKPYDKAKDYIWKLIFTVDDYKKKRFKLK